MRESGKDKSGRLEHEQTIRAEATLLEAMESMCGGYLNSRKVTNMLQKDISKYAFVLVGWCTTRIK